MILSFNEFNALNESNDYGYSNNYSDGIDIMESLMTVIAKKGSITETQAYTFLDNVLYDTGYELNDEVYENYSEWINDWTPFIDASVNEAEEEMDLYLTRRGEIVLESGIQGPVRPGAHDIGVKASQAAGGFKDSISNITGRFKTHRERNAKAKNTGAAKQLIGAAKKTWQGSSRNQKIGMGVAGAAAAGAVGYGAYKGIKALKKRSAAKKAAAAGAQPQH